MSNFYVTYSGYQVHPDNLDSTYIDIQDIAHHLTKIQRFGGALPLDKNYSVAEHLILLAQHARMYYTAEVASLCLLHDAAEAYLGDVVTALKEQLPDYKELEDQMEEKIYKTYNVNTRHIRIVKWLDSRILLRVMSASSFVFHGSGFYVIDYKNKE